MNGGDFYGSERSFISDQNDLLRVVFQGDSSEEVLRENLEIEVGEIVDAAVTVKKRFVNF